VTRYLDPRRPRAFAHRGWHTGELAGLENSMAAFQRAVDEGIRYLETDVHATRDGVLVAFHDSVLDRVSDGKGSIASQSWEQVRRARIGGLEPVPLMADVLAAFPDAMVNIDAKSDAAVGPLIDLITSSRAQDRVCLGSFSGRRLRALRAALGPGVATSLAPGEVLPLLPPGGLLSRKDVRSIGAVAAQVPVRYGRQRIVTPRFVGLAHSLGLEVHAWTIDDAEQMRELLDIGVDGIMTDRPDVLRTVYRSLGFWQ
jgi:glycerophosphoryl diester phosphodiesterase